MLPSSDSAVRMGGEWKWTIMSRTILKSERAFENCLAETSWKTPVILAGQNVGGTIVKWVC